VPPAMPHKPVDGTSEPVRSSGVMALQSGPVAIGSLRKVQWRGGGSFFWGFLTAFFALPSIRSAQCRAVTRIGAREAFWHSGDQPLAL
jgi:hypothetical protein